MLLIDWLIEWAPRNRLGACEGALKILVKHVKIGAFWTLAPS